MSFDIYCPFCASLTVCDRMDTIHEVDGVFQCPNGHVFVLMYGGMR